jgi:protein-S-isoprenylcysteine O-methyltransferase Ste14
MLPVMRAFSGYPAEGALFVITVVGWLILELRQSRQHRSEATEMDRGSRQVLWVCYILGWFIAASAAGAIPATAIGYPLVAFGAGLVITWAGVGLRLWSFATLGRYFTFHVMASADQPVISNGPYRVLRHPSYAGGELAFIGVGLMYGNWISVAALTLLPLIGIVNRIRVEEKALFGTLGDAYARYAATHKRLIPSIW